MNLRKMKLMVETELSILRLQLINILMIMTILAYCSAIAIMISGTFHLVTSGAVDYYSLLA